MKKTKNVALIGVLGALAFVVMLFEIPFPLAPWLKFDLSDIVVVFGGLVGGPLVAIAITVVKLALKVMIKGTETGLVGETANLIATLAYSLIVILIYEKTKKISLGLILGTLSLAVVLILVNYFYITPFYAKLYKMDFILEMINKKDGSYLKYIVGLYGGFNLFKGIIQSGIYLFINKKLQNRYRIR
ncbi:MAG: ECF transporter S component [Fusobacteriaceae bacterium]